MGERDWSVLERRCSDPTQGLAWGVFAFFRLSQSKAYGGELFVCPSQLLVTDSFVRSMSPLFMDLVPERFSLTADQFNLEPRRLPSFTKSATSRLAQSLHVVS